jgi:peptide/nickel transport system permease protein
VVKYVGLRVLQAIPVLIGITIVSFILIHLVPGDPARLQLGPRASAAQVEALQHQLGLDKPLLDQYVSFLGNAAHLQFGQSLSLHQPVGGVIRAKVGLTALLVAYSLLISLLIAIPLGLLAAVKRDRLTDHAIRIGGMVFYVMPVFWFGLLLSLVFGLQLGLLPTGGYESGAIGSVRSLTLPAVTLGIVTGPLFLRSLRASAIQVLDSGYTEAARARGFAERRILFRHVWRPASISTVTLVGLTIGVLLSGTVVVESVFGLPGMGTLLVSAVSSRDFPLIQGLVFVMAAAVVVVNLLADLAYAVIDPRVRL